MRLRFPPCVRPHPPAVEKIWQNAAKVKRQSASFAVDISARSSRLADLLSETTNLIYAEYQVSRTPHARQ
jgi:hypothetical protein